MTHNLVANYGLDRNMDILRPKRATREQMAKFHSDEYVDFLNRVTPETMADLTGDGSRCELLVVERIQTQRPNRSGR